MKIPVELLHKILWFVYDHFNGKGLVGNPAEVAARCGLLAKQWLDEASPGVACCGYSEVQLISFCERLGRHLSIFFISERED
jgi:hypothetical protein